MNWPEHWRSFLRKDKEKAVEDFFLSLPTVPINFSGHLWPPTPEHYAACASCQTARHQERLQTQVHFRRN